MTEPGRMSRPAFEPTEPGEPGEAAFDGYGRPPAERAHTAQWQAAPGERADRPARTTNAAPAAAPATGTGAGVPSGRAWSTAGGSAGLSPSGRGGSRRAKLVLRHIDPWTVMKFGFAFSIGMLVVFVVAVIVLYGVLSAMGVVSSVNTTVNDLTSSAADGSGGVQNVLSAPKIIGAAILIGAINVVLLTALGTLCAFLYNLCTDLVGGVEVTMTER